MVVPSYFAARPQRASDALAADDHLVSGSEFFTGIRNRAYAVGKQGLDRADVLRGETHEEALERLPVAQREFGPRPHAPSLVGADRAARPVMRCLEIRFGDVERLRRFADVVVEDIA